MIRVLFQKVNSGSLVESTGSDRGQKQGDQLWGYKRTVLLQARDVDGVSNRRWQQGYTQEAEFLDLVVGITWQLICHFIIPFLHNCLCLFLSDICFWVCPDFSFFFFLSNGLYTVIYIVEIMTHDNYNASGYSSVNTVWLLFLWILFFLNA